MLVWRIPIGIGLAVSAVALFALDHRLGQIAPLFAVLCIFLALRSTWELADLLRIRSFDPHLGLMCVLCVCVVFANWIPRITPAEYHPKGQVNPILVAYALAVLVLFVHRAARYQTPGKSMETLGSELIILSYVGVLLSFTAQLRWVAGPALSYLPLGSLIVVAKAGDTFAFFSGRLFGRTKLAPQLSPGKTRAGAIGAVIGSAIGGWAWFQFATPFFSADYVGGPAVFGILYGMIIGVVGLLGDLCESLIKRDVGRKDSAVLLPGFGGVLDVLDSVIFAGPVAYVLWLFLPLVTPVRQLSAEILHFGAF